MQLWYEQIVTETLPRDTIVTEKLLNYASKFFHIHNIITIEPGNDNFQTHICMGMNGIKSYMTKRKPFVETFCYAAIFHNFANATAEDSIQIRKTFGANVKKAGMQKQHGELEERLLYLRTLCYELMQQVPALLQLLQQAYKEKKTWLPFVWVE